MIGAGSRRAGRGRRDQLAGCRLGRRMEGLIMRIRRTILAPVILALSTAGALVTSPVLAVTAAAASASAAVASGTTAPAVTYYHG
jgi:hypothetical protein